MRQTFAAEGFSASPPANSRTMGMMGGAVFDAVNSISRNYSSYLGYFDPATSGVGIDVNAAAATAAYQVMSSVYSDYYGSGNPFQNAFDTLYNTQMASFGAGDARTRGVEVGAAAAAAMINFRSNDGWNSTPTYSPQTLGTVGRWQPGTTVGAWGAISTETFLKSQWSDMTPFTMSSTSQFRPAGPDGFKPDNYTGWVQSQAYTNDFNLIKNIGGTNSTIRTADQTNIAYFWVDGPGTASPPGHWNRIAQALSTSMGLSIEENARLFALLNLAMADTGISTWEAKVFYDTWRPMFAINNADTDGNPDTLAEFGWAPLIPTPSFGAYTSGHSAFSMAGATILAAFFGTDDIAFTSDSESPFLAPGYTRDFDSFSQAALEAGMSRIYGGIHFMSDNVDGAILGGNVADNVFSNFLQPVPEPASALLLALAGMACLRRRRHQ